MRKHILVVMTAILVLALATVAMASDPFVGTWKLNIAKSKYNPGPAPKGETVKIETQNNGFRWTFEGAESDGKAIHGEWSGKYDGKDYSLEGNSNADTAASRKTDANTLDSVLKKGGNVVGDGQVIISKNGKTLTLIEKGKNAQGQDINNIQVFDKQ